MTPPDSPRDVIVTTEAGVELVAHYMTGPPEDHPPIDPGFYTYVPASSGVGYYDIVKGVTAWREVPR